MGSGGMSRFGNQTYGLSPQFLDSLGIDGPLHNRLFVANLAYSVDEKKLREVFRLAGRVVTAELNRDKVNQVFSNAISNNLTKSFRKISPYIAFMTKEITSSMDKNLINKHNSELQMKPPSEK